MSDCWDKTQIVVSTDKVFSDKNNEVEINFLSGPRRQIQLIGCWKSVVELKNKIQKLWETFLTSTQQIINQSSTTSNRDCSICLNESNYSLQACGHLYCHECLKTYLSQYFSGVQVEIKCPADQCNSLLLLRDIKTILHSDENIKKISQILI